MTDKDLYYLRSCLRQLSEYQALFHDTAMGPTIASECLADNIDWLDCFIEQQERAQSPDAIDE